MWVLESEDGRASLGEGQKREHFTGSWGLFYSGLRPDLQTGRWLSQGGSLLCSQIPRKRTGGVAQDRATGGSTWVGAGGGGEYGQEPFQWFQGQERAG